MCIQQMQLIGIRADDGLIVENDQVKYPDGCVGRPIIIPSLTIDEHNEDAKKVHVELIQSRPSEFWSVHPLQRPFRYVNNIARQEREEACITNKRIGNKRKTAERSHS